MPLYPPITTQWDQTGLMPSGNIEFWHQYRFGQSGHEVIFDYSGNGRHIGTGAGVAPVLTEEVLNGQPGWVFDGDESAMLDAWSTPAFSLKHLFILVRIDLASFGSFLPLLGDSAFNIILGGDTGTTKWQDNYTGSYYKNGTSYVDGNRQAPMQEFALIECIIPAGETIDQLMLNTFDGLAFTFIEMAGWSEVLSDIQRRQANLYYNLRYRVHEFTDSAIPLYFPSVDLVPEIAGQGRVNNRFNDRAIDWSQITEEFEYEDGGKDFNELNDAMPLRWEYTYQNVPKAQKVIFDTFNNVARRANPFFFKDKEDMIWSNVRIESYDRNHDEHKRWRNDVMFGLVGMNTDLIGVEAESADFIGLPDVEDGMSGGESDVEDGGFLG
jgi:hypothetical protein